MLHIVADNEEAAREGALKMVEKHVKNPVVTGVFEATEEILPVETPRTIN